MGDYHAESIRANLMKHAQDLYDELTCAGIRNELWPAPAEDDDALGNRLERAFEAINDYIDAVKS
jgi:hypothetical protein